MAALEVEVEGLEDERGGVTGIDGDGAVGLGDSHAGDLAGGLGGAGSTGSAAPSPSMRRGPHA